MNISIKATHLDLTPSIKQYIEEKVGNLAKYLPGVLEAKVELERDRHHHTGLVFRAEIMIIAGGKVMRAEERGEDAYAAVDLVVPELKEQMTKFKSKRETMEHRGARSAKKRR